MTLFRNNILTSLVFIFLFNATGFCTPGLSNKYQTAQEKYSLALEHRSISAIVRALTERGVARKTSHPDSAYMDLMLALKFANRFNLTSLRPGIFLELAGLHSSNADIQTAAVLFDSARNSAARIGDYATLSTTLNLLGTLQLDLLNNKEAKSLFTASYNTAISHELYSQAGVAMSNLARFSTDTDSSVQMMRHAIALIGKEKNTGHFLAGIYINLGNRMSNPDSAIGYYEKAMTAMQVMPDHPVIVMQAINNMAYSLLEKGKPGEADELLQRKAIPIALANQDYDWLATLYDTRADVMEAQSKYKEAFRLEKMAVKTRGLAESRSASQQVRLLLLLLDVRNKDVKITTAQLQIKLQQQRISKLKISLIASLAVILTGIIGFVILRQRSKIKAQQQEILAIRQQAEAADEERNRLSRQLHDLTGQIDKKMVSKIKLMTSADESTQAKLASEWTKLSSTIHSLSYRLNQDMVADIPLADSIRNLVDEYNHIGDLHIRFDVGPGTVFPVNHKTHMSYIIQELLNNALKHGGACNVTLQLTCEANNHYLFYNDNGPGFDAKTNSHISMGINNIFERAKLMDGIATLITSPGDGTRWIVAIPFNDQDKHEQVG